MPTLKNKGRRGTLGHVRNSYRPGNQRNDVPRRRTEIDPGEAAGLPARFALHLRQIMADRGWTSKNVSDLLRRKGVDVGPRGVDVWLRGEGSPKFRDLEQIGRALGLDDYRMVLPPPRKK